MKHSIIRRLTSAALVLLILLLFNSCGPRVIARGILLWSPDESEISSGSAVDILTESELRNVYDIRYTDSEGREQFEQVERWRVEKAENRDALPGLIEDYADFAPFYGVSEVQALPIRDFMVTDNSSQILYRLREGERVKILSRTEETVDLGGLVDYWFEVLTEDGTRGYVFGYRLDVVDAEGISVERQEETEDAVLTTILNTIWRPDYYGAMIRDATFDLSRFRPEYRFAHDADSRSFTLLTENMNRTFAYEDIFQARFRVYSVTGTSLQISYINDRSISLQFTEDGQTQQVSLTRVEEDVAELISLELERRARLLEEFVSRGRNLASSQYGSITLYEEGNLLWNRYGSVDPSILPSWFSGAARLSFSLYLARDLQASYDGVVTFTQSGQSIRNSMNFFYRFTNGGLQLEYIPSQSIDRNIVLRQALSPFVMFFSISD